MRASFLICLSVLLYHHTRTSCASLRARAVFPRAWNLRVATMSMWKLVPQPPREGGLTFDTGRYQLTPGCAPAADDAAPGGALPLPTGALVCLSPRGHKKVTHWRWARGNIGHAAQYLFKCWSFIIATEQQLAEQEASEEAPHHSSNRSHQHLTPSPRQRLIIDRLYPRQGAAQIFGGQPWALKTMAVMNLSVAWAAQRLPACSAQWSVPLRALAPGDGDLFFDKPRSAWRLAAATLRLSLHHTGMFAGERHGHYIGDHHASSPTCNAKTKAGQPCGHAGSGRGGAGGAGGAGGEGVLVGVLLRGRGSESEGRDWPHAAAFAAAVNADPPAGVLGAEVFSLTARRSNETSTPSLRLQAEAVRRYAIIVSAHGSHSVGLAYIRPCTVLLELLSPTWLLPLFSGLAVSAGGRAFFMHSAANVSEALGATRRVVFGGFGGRVVSRNAGSFNTLQPQAVHATLPALLASHRRCLAGEPEPSVPMQDRVPTFGGNAFFDESVRLDPAACLTCEQPVGSGADEDGGGACCDSLNARLAYAEAGFACEHCLPRFRQLPSGNASCPREYQAFTCWEPLTKSPPVSRG